MIEATGCEACQLVLRCLPERLEGLRHYSVQLGDWRGRVTLNGQPLDDVYEMVAGRGGWAIRVDVARAGVDAHGVPQRCACGSGLVPRFFDRDDGYNWEPSE